MFVCKGCGKKFKTNKSINRLKKLVRGKRPCGAMTTIEEIILNLNVRGEDGRKRAVLASSRKRADILYHLNCFAILIFVCVTSIFLILSLFLFEIVC